MSLMNVVSLLAGLGLFLYGMHLMGDSLEKAAGGRFKHLLELVTHNRILAMLAGVVVTAVVQSSSATTVMLVGFVNASLMTLNQAIGVIMGANIGTTVTSLLLSIRIDFGAIFACGALLLSILPKKLKWPSQASTIAIGLGVIFIGMDMMSSAMEPLREWEGFREAILSISNPVVGVLLGTGITAVLQSSAASIGILQALAGDGLIPLQTSLFILYGQNIGTCVTALIACAGTSRNAKRVAVAHLLIKLIGAVVFVIITCTLPLSEWIASLAPGNMRLQIALGHILFNVANTVLLLPATNLIEKAACMIIPDAPTAAEAMRLRYFDKRLLSTPPIAVNQLFREVQRMGDIASDNLARAMACFDEYNEETAAEVNTNEDVLDFLNKEISARLVDVGALDLNDSDAHLLGSLFHVVIDLERVGDHAINILDAARAKHEGDIRFTAKVRGELDDLYSQVSDQLTLALDILRRQKDIPEQQAEVAAAEDAIDQRTEELRAHHVERLKNRKCSARNGALYLDMLTNLERIADHAENIATSVHPTQAAV